MLPSAASLLNVSGIRAHKRQIMRTNIFRPGGMKNAHTRPNRKTFHLRGRHCVKQVEELIGSRG
jgi:hypothetical protein